MTKVKILIFFMGIIFISAAQQNISIKGKVVDDQGAPVGLAHVTLTDADTAGGNEPSNDTVFTKNDGTFQKKITISNNAQYVVYIVIHKDFKVKTGAKFPISNEMDCGTISMESFLPSDTLSISGVAQDKNTNEPLENAMVILSVASLVPGFPDTTYTDNNGKFSHTMPGSLEGVGPVEPLVRCHISKANYETVKDSVKPTALTVDFGIMQLVPENQSILPDLTPLLKSGYQPTMILFTLKGQTLFQGTGQDMIDFLKTHKSAVQGYIIRQRYEGFGSLQKDKLWIRLP